MIPSLVLPSIRPLAVDGEDTILRRHVDVARLTSRDFDRERQILVGLADVDRGSPLVPDGLAATERILEQLKNVPPQAEGGCGHGRCVQHVASMSFWGPSYRLAGQPGLDGSQCFATTT